MEECNGIVFYRSFYEAVKDLPPEEFKKAVSAILEYGLNGLEPESSGGIEWMVYTLTKPQLDANQKRRENGGKGGRPVTEENQGITKPKPNHNQNEANNNQSVTKAEPKDKDKVKEKDKAKVKEKDNMSPGTSAGHSSPQDKSGKTDNDQAYPYAEIVDYLNQTTGASFRYQSKDTQQHIRARFQEGFTLEQFKIVIEKKAREWGKEPDPGRQDMRPYLRPATLFGKNFESYLNQPDTSRKETTEQHNSYDIDAFERGLDKIPQL